ncbi:hypothetical protein AAOGI_44400 [Agarivorans albus]
MAETNAQQDRGLFGNKKEEAEPQGEKKAGMMDKVKEMLPGAKKEGGNNAHYAQTQQTGPKKGFVEKIKEKIPGQHKK